MKSFFTVVGFSFLLAASLYNSAEALLITPTYDFVPVELPSQFTPSSGIKLDSNTHLIGGVYQNKPAYLTISKSEFGTPVISGITVLPSLSVSQVGIGGNPEGQIQEIVRNVNGDVTLIGYSRSEDTSILNAFGKGTTWNFRNGIATGYGTNNSGLFAGNSNGVFVGNSVTGSAIVTDGLLTKTLPNNGNFVSYAQGISDNNKYIIGSVGSNIVYWQKNSMGEYNLMNNLESPTAGGPIGFANGIVENLAAGQYWNPIIEGYCAAIWDLNTGAMVRTFDQFGGIDADVAFASIGGESVAVFSSSEGKDPLVHLFNENKTFSLNELVPNSQLFNGMRVLDIWEGSLSFIGIGGNGNFVFQSFNTQSELPTDIPEPCTIVLISSFILVLERKKFLQTTR